MNPKSWRKIASLVVVASLLIVLIACAPTKYRSYEGPEKPINQVALVLAPAPLAPGTLNGKLISTDGAVMTSGGYLEITPGEYTLRMLLMFKASNAIASKGLPDIKLKAAPNMMYWYMPYFRDANSSVVLNKTIPLSRDWPGGYSYTLKRDGDKFVVSVYDPATKKWTTPKCVYSDFYFDPKSNAVSYAFKDGDGRAHVIVDGKLVHRDQESGDVLSTVAFGKNGKHFAYIKDINETKILVVDGKKYTLPESIQAKEIPSAYVDNMSRYSYDTLRANEAFDEFEIATNLPLCPYRLSGKKGGWVQYRFPCGIVKVKLADLKE